MPEERYDLALMLPVTLTLIGWPVFVLGHGAPAVRRLRQVQDAGHDDIRVFCPDPDAEILQAAGSGLIRRWPTPEDWKEARLAFVAGETEAVSRALAEAARSVRVPVNVEDMPDLCDFHVPAMVRRGVMVLTAATGGAAPGFARLLREDLERRYGPEWRERLQEISALRRDWRAQGHDMATVARMTRDYVVSKGWFA